ncbi:Uncharacterized protein YpbQ, isoprenylcysteine carboxyl methyltransferase (ICMT) family [Sphingomonas sp. NFR04]|nr:Uncharacterized protein YpbQ, isoprenylcysteine carboxyl methyltransferase (ICMT) family [Sphingomonas sp. NFR04]
MLIGFIIAAFVYRFVMLAVSVRNEKALRRDGAVECGARNSTALAAAHVAFYLTAAAEGIVRNDPFDAVSAIGLCIYLFGAVMLLVVSRMLGPLWTVKLLVARNHRLVTNRLFRMVRHPNYYLNILPELIGFALTLHAYGTLLVGMVVYAVPLTLRIRLEEQVMRGNFAEY